MKPLGPSSSSRPKRRGGAPQSGRGILARARSALAAKWAAANSPGRALRVALNWLHARARSLAAKLHKMAPLRLLSPSLCCSFVRSFPGKPAIRLARPAKTASTEKLHSRRALNRSHRTARARANAARRPDARALHHVALRPTLAPSAGPQLALKIVARATF